ncbi:thermonuclease family protein [Cohnella panacarvi]|uniref:thermonuclease family protein n=1 Tax=Cohnella panacarvi TaxID=400776 RepID=UPI00047EB5DC|nr:thermonuclease family protein [Cohnella panacarvi]
MGKHAIRIVGLLALLIIAGCAGQSELVSDDADLASIYERYPELSDRTPEEAVVARVVDGDTFETKTGSKVRLVGVNTPEKYGKVEYYGVEASAYTEQRLAGKAVYMFKDVSETDRYGRLLRFVFIKGEATMYNELLVREGYANVMTYPPDVTYAKYFLKVERTARESGVGLWASEEPAAQETPVTGHSADEGPGCAEPQIKGNIKSGGKEKIYHIPGGKSYNQTKAEAMFCTEEEAQAAGFRKASR